MGSISRFSRRLRIVTTIEYTPHCPTTALWFSLLGQLGTGKILDETLDLSGSHHLSANTMALDARDGLPLPSLYRLWFSLAS